jgi:hypothetical protein
LPKSGSFARGDVYLTASYHGDKGSKTEFLIADVAAGFILRENHFIGWLVAVN